MLNGRPDFTAGMRVSTIVPTGTRRRRNAISSVNLTGAPENSARIQMLAKVAIMSTNTNSAMASSAQRISFTALNWNVCWARSNGRCCIVLGFGLSRRFGQSTDDNAHSFDGDDFDRRVAINQDRKRKR